MLRAKIPKRKRSKPHILLLTCVSFCHDASFEGPIDMGFQVPSPTYVNKSQHGGKVPTFEPQHTITIWFVSISFGPTLIYVSKFLGHMLRVGFSFLLDLTLNTSPKHHLQRLLPCRHSCHTWDLGLWTSCEVVNPNFHALNDRDYTNWPQVT
jgi:hypothetical protein